MNKSISPTRTYLALVVRDPNSLGYSLKKFVLPEIDKGLGGDEEPRSLENNSETAIWYYLNRVDGFDTIDGCLSFEDILTMFPAKSGKDYVLTHLSEARRLLKHIQQDAGNGQISDIIQDIGSFFEKYPYFEWVTEETNE